jgi:hypothetical protein
MSIAVGIDIAKEVHWATAIDEAGAILLDQRVANQPAALDELVTRLRSLGGEVTIGLDVVGVHVSGLAVNRARQGFAGGESKSDPRDARVIAEQVRARRDLRPCQPAANSRSRSGCSSPAGATSSSIRPDGWRVCTTSWPACIPVWSTSLT